MESKIMIRKFYHYDQLVGTTEVSANSVVLTKVVEKPKYRYSHVDAEWSKITSDPTPIKSDTDVSLDTLFEDLKFNNQDNNSFVMKMAFVYGKKGSLTDPQINVLKKILRDAITNQARAKNQDLHQY